MKGGSAHDGWAPDGVQKYEKRCPFSQVLYYSRHLEVKPGLDALVHAINAAPVAHDHALPTPFLIIVST